MKILIAVIIFSGIIFLSVGAFFLGSKYKILITPLSSLSSQAPLSNSFSEISQAPLSETKNQTPLLNGSLTKLSSDLKLFSFSPEDLENKVDKDVVYYSAGVFSRGTFQGFTRIIAIRPPIGPGQSLVFILATKDYITYTLFDEDQVTKQYSEADWENPLMYLDKQKVTSVEKGETDHEKIIQLSQTQSLFKEEIPTISVETTQKDSFGQLLYEIQIAEKKQTYNSLPSPISTLSFFSIPYEKNPYTDKLEQKEQEQEKIRDTYSETTTQVIVLDSTGLPFSYSVSTPQNIQSYLPKKQQYDKDLAEFNIQVKAFQNKEIKVYPSNYPEYPSRPNLRFKGSDLGISTPLYQTYDIAIPHACSTSVETLVVKAVTDSDLTKIGSVNSISIYALKNNNHPLLKLAYENKINLPDEGFSSANENKKKPTYSEYVQKNPLLFVKDFWGRWVALGEYDYQLMGGCGKPVVYLYPETPTDVFVSFTVPVKLTTNIPHYQNGWNVKAYPDGTLVDLQPENTSCESLRKSSVGSEYAYNACINNSYPYLYWSGTITNKQYPVLQEGWVISSENLSQFLENKLTEIGLSSQEKQDMISYWVPEMKKEQAPFYRISFFQTQIMNDLAPMKIIPQPDSVSRLFLDYTPLTHSVEIKPQKLVSIVRHGFTVVEWGGLKR